MWTVVALGNPGKEYAYTRHNAGRIVLGHFLRAFGFDDLTYSKKYQGLFVDGKLGKISLSILFPETFMNKSGVSVSSLITSKKKAEQLIVVHDDLDLPLGRIKISWNRGTGGHRGVLSLVKHLKTEGFIRIRIGVSPETPGGKLKKPKGESAVDAFIVGEFREKEIAILKKVSKNVTEAIETIVLYGLPKAMSLYNQ